MSSPAGTTRSSVIDPEFKLRSHARNSGFALVLLAAASCSQVKEAATELAGGLSRSKAATLISADSTFSKELSTLVPKQFEIFCWENNKDRVKDTFLPLVQRGVLVMTNTCGVELTEVGRILSQQWDMTFPNYYHIPIGRMSLERVSGIVDSAGTNTIKLAEFLWRFEPNETGQVFPTDTKNFDVQLGLPRSGAGSAVITKYDDGWRLTRLRFENPSWIFALGGHSWATTP